MTQQNVDTRWTLQQIEDYHQVYPRYVKAAEVINKVLEAASKPLAPKAIIQARAKSVPSFTEKALRKKKAGRYDDPIRQMTDLCGARVITQTLAEVHALSKFIENHFIIDTENSVDVSERLSPSEFGYRSIHYIVQFKHGAFPTTEIPIKIPEELYPDATHPMKIEIQVRTMLEHTWASFVHDRAYKSAYKIPPKWERELAVLAGMLEQTDQSFARIQSSLRTYAASYGAYLNEEQLKDEINILESVLTCDPENPELAYRIGKLAMELGDWTKTIEIFSKFVDTGYQPILRDLGVVICKVNAGDPHGEAYKQGQKYLKIASSSPYRDADALASLAGTWKKLDETKTRELYRQAFEVDPTDPYAVSNYLVYEINHQGNLTPASLMAPSLKEAIQRSQDQAEVGMNLPWAFYNLGIFHLLLGQPYESLNAYTKAIQLSTTDWMVETTAQLLEKLYAVRDLIAGYDWVYRLLLFGRATKFAEKTSLEHIKDLATANASPLESPVIIVAGGTSSEFQVEKYEQLILNGFHAFHGTVIGGGTTAGISGLVGKIQQAYRESVSTLGYLPQVLPEGTAKDSHYQKVRSIAGNEFNALQPLQYWSDILTSGISPDQVKLIGINGGKISAFEYRLALMLGASVAVIENSGREASRLFKDIHWKNSGNLHQLSAETREIESFINLKIK